MDGSFLNSILETLDLIGKFLFESYQGIAILIISVIVITLIIAYFLEKKTRKDFADRSLELQEDTNTSEKSITKSNTKKTINNAKRQ